GTLEMTPQGAPEAAVVNPANVAPTVEDEAPTVRSFAPQGLEFDLDEIAAKSAEAAATEAPILAPTPQAVGMVAASAVNAPTQAEQAQTAPVVQAASKGVWVMTWLAG